MLELLKKGGGAPVFIPDIATLIGERDETVRIRCPLCGWSPDKSSVWLCESLGTPEPYFGGCGHMWNTFDTRGKCPACAHQWRWTSCLRCQGWSRHVDWYQKGG